MNNYIQFYKDFEQDNNEVDAAYLTSDDFFDFNGYLLWQEQRSERNTDNNIEFIRQLVQTQGFHKFIEQNSLSSKNGTYSMAEFFEDNVALINQHPFKKLRAAQQEMID